MKYSFSLRCLSRRSRALNGAHMKSTSFTSFTNVQTHSQPQPAALGTRVALHPFLTGMSRPHLALLADCAIATHFEKGQTILRKGQFAEGFYLIESGEVV